MYYKLHTVVSNCCVAWEQDVKLNVKLFRGAEDEQTEYQTKR